MTATIGVMPQPPRKNVRSFRVEDEVWEEALRIATARQESLGDVVLRKALVAYIKKHADKN